MARKKVIDVLISPTTRCNLRCKYCYIAQDQKTERADLDIDDIKSAYNWLNELAEISEAERIRLTWFGGEPLLRGVGFLRNALSLQTKHFTKSFEIVNTMQSNLTLVTDELIPLLAENFHSSIGGSIDFKGIDRLFPNGDDSTPIVEHNIKRLQDAGINVGIVCTLTKSNTSDPKSLYEYYKGLGTSFRINRAASISSSPNQNLSITEYNAFVKKLFDIYLSDTKPTVEFTNFVMMAKLYLTGLPVVCVDSRSPHLFLGIEAQGRVMSRCRFESPLGNYRKESPQAFFDKCQRLSCQHRAPQKCSSCEFFDTVCQGACPGEPQSDCFNSRCGYRTETTYELWCYVRDYLSQHGHVYGELKEYI